MKSLLITESEKRRILNMHNKKRSQVFEGVIPTTLEPVNYLTNLYFDASNTKWDQAYKIVEITPSDTGSAKEKWGQIMNIKINKEFKGAINCDDFGKGFCENPRATGGETMLKYDCTTGAFDLNGQPRYQNGIKNELEQNWCPKEVAPGKANGSKYASIGTGTNDGSSSVA
jgi:hypothetical protein